MPKFSNGKVTTNVIFYNRGVPNKDKSFGTYAAVNYSILTQSRIYNRRFGTNNNL
jgi:hypothetical protein